MEHCGSAAECGFTDRILTGGAEHVFLKRGDHCGRDAGGGPGGAAGLRAVKAQCSSGNAQKLDSWSDKDGVTSPGGGTDRMHRIPDRENVAEDAGAESDQHGYGIFNTQVFTYCGVRDQLLHDNFYCS